VLGSFLFIFCKKTPTKQPTLLLVPSAPLTLCHHPLLPSLITQRALFPPLETSTRALTRVSSSLVPAVCFSTSKAHTQLLPPPHSPPLSSPSLLLCWGFSPKLSPDHVLPICHLLSPAPVSASSLSCLLLQQCLLRKPHSLPPPGPSFSAGTWHISVPLCFGRQWENQRPD